MLQKVRELFQFILGLDENCRKAAQIKMLHYFVGRAIVQAIKDRGFTLSVHRMHSSKAVQGFMISSEEEDSKPGATT